jgi:hypothetical protein
VQSAYLAIVSYPSASDQSIALCVTGVIDADRQEIVQAVSNTFASIFNAHEHLDILFPTDAQKDQLGQVCQPFFARSIPPDSTVTGRG